MWNNTYLAEQDMDVRVKESHREVEQRKLQRLGRDPRGRVLGGLLNAATVVLNRSAKLVKDVVEAARALYTAPQTS